MEKVKSGFNVKQLVIWVAALGIGAVLGSLGVKGLNEFMDFVASAYTRCFQFVAVPTVALAVITALASLGDGRNMGKVFAKTFSMTVLTSLLAALVGLGLYLLVQPGALDPHAIQSVSADTAAKVSAWAEHPDTVYGHILNAVIPKLIKAIRNKG